VSDRTYVVDVDTLADILRVERSGFQPISVSVGQATRFLVKDRLLEGGITNSKLSASNVLLHKVVINCIRLKATSKIDVSRFETKLMFAICNGKRFSLPRTITMHRYRTIMNDK